MDVGQAVKLMKLGKKVRRGVWQTGEHIIIKDNDINMYIGKILGYARVLLDNKDLLALDWEVYIDD